MKGNKGSIILILLLIILAIVAIVISINNTKKTNKTFIENYISKEFPNYRVVEIKHFSKRYLSYLGGNERRYF